MVRFGKLVWSPLACHADIVIATELLEGRRALLLLPPQGALVCARTVIAPGSVLRGEAEYPHDIEAAAAARSVTLLLVDAEAVARRAGTVRAANVALLGAASVKLPFGEPAWQQGLAAAIPAKILEVNQCAFALGREAHLHEEVRQ
jgi:indolepyruvate ferredoxin oxidoreductase beta subunit